VAFFYLTIKHAIVKNSSLFYGAQRTNLFINDVAASIIPPDSISKCSTRCTVRASREQTETLKALILCHSAHDFSYLRGYFNCKYSSKFMTEGDGYLVSSTLFKVHILFYGWFSTEASGNVVVCMSMFSLNDYAPFLVAVSFKIIVSLFSSIFLLFCHKCYNSISLP